MAELNVRVGKKVDESKIDKSKGVKGQKPTQEGGAEAQGGAHYWSNVSCCNCWSVNVVSVSSSHYVTFACWNCGAWCDV